MKLYYKADTGYNRSVSFSKNELDKVIYAFLMERRVLLSDGQAVDGKYIQQISPDWHRIMGWSDGYRLGPDDYNELSDKGIDLAARNYQAIASERVKDMIAEGRQPGQLAGATNPQLNEGH